MSKRVEPSLGVMSLLLVVELVWIVLWTPRSDFVMGIWSLLAFFTLVYFIVIFPEQYKLVRRDEQEPTTHSTRGDTTDTPR